MFAPCDRGLTALLNTPDLQFYWFDRLKNVLDEVLQCFCEHSYWPVGLLKDVFAASNSTRKRIIMVTEGDTEVAFLTNMGRLGHHQAGHDLARGPRIALLTPYDGGNLGDAAIQDAVIANLRLRLPGAQFSGISLNCRSFIERHGIDAFPLCATDRPFYAMTSKNAAARKNQKSDPAVERSQRPGLMKNAIGRVPGLPKFLMRLCRWALIFPKELLHCARGCRFLGTQDLLIVSGGGQLDDEWGGAWGHPYALFKWALLARLAWVPCAFASVGTGRMQSRVSRLLFSAALRLARYRSYRDENSKRITISLLKRAANDPVVPDLAFGLPVLEMPASSDIRSLSAGRTVVAISPIAFGKRGSWPSQDHAVHDRYLLEMAQVMSRLVDRGYFLVIVCSSLGDDESVVPELLNHLGFASKENLLRQIHVPVITSWRDIAATFRQADLLVASRLHSTLIGLVTHTPTVAISFDPKVDWLMEDIGLPDCLLQIRNFTADDVLRAIDRVQSRRAVIVDRIESYQEQIQSGSCRQYDTLAGLAALRTGFRFEPAHEH